MFNRFNRRFAFEFDGDWGGWTPPWLRPERPEHWHGGPREHWHGPRWHGPRHFGMRMRRGLFGPGGPFGPEGPFEGRRFFGRGDLKFALLELLQERPMHGYEMMKALEERSGGFYSPSAGSIYPTLQLLEDRELVTVNETGGKKVYSITEAGRAFLGEHRREEPEFVPPWAREFGRRWNDPDMQTLRNETVEVARLFAVAGRQALGDPQTLTRLRTIIEGVRKDLSDLINSQSGQPNTPAQPTPTEEA